MRPPPRDEDPRRSGGAAVVGDVQPPSRRRVGVVAVPVWAVAATVLVLLVQGTLSPLHALTSSSSELRQFLSSSAEEWDHRVGGPWIPAPASSAITGGGGDAGHLGDESNIIVPKRSDGSKMSLEERVRYLELKTNAFMNFGADPFFGSKPRAEDMAACVSKSSLIEFGCVEGFEGYLKSRPKCPGQFDHRICLDRLPPPRKWEPGLDDEAAGAGAASSALVGEEGTSAAPCLVYDFGVREQPQFGAVMARTFGCEVHAFDPSPVSLRWWKSSEAQNLRALSNYQFHPYGAGGVDGDLNLMQYDWDQVSILRFPKYVVDCGDTLEGHLPCKTPLAFGDQKEFKLPVKTLHTIRRELGHHNRTIDVLKVDVEGSEYSFLEVALDRGGGGLPFVDQLTLEWHHMPWDARYGEGSSPSINAIVTLLRASGLRLFWQHSLGGWPSNVRSFQRLGMKDIRYNAATFLRVK